LTESSSHPYNKIVNDITSIGLDWHSETILENSVFNSKKINKSILDLNAPIDEKASSAIVISAGPSLYKNNILERIKSSGFKGSIIAIDGSYVRCLKAGLIPDYLLTLDPHPTRIVRWFGDPNLDKNTKNDDYFLRQDLDIAFRDDTKLENKKNIQLVDKYGKNQKLIICSTAPKNVVERVNNVGFDTYWWAPLVDNPNDEKSLTREIVKKTNLPAMNTGGTVGTASWVFAHTALKIKHIAVVGMDLGYYKSDTSYEQTQTFYELKKQIGDNDLKQYFPETSYPGKDEVFFTDPTYGWYKNNFLSLIKASNSQVYNCSGGGTLSGSGINCIEIEQFCKLKKT